MRKTELTTVLLTVASIVSAWLLYPHMPPEMASHWNAAGEVDGYMSKFWGLALFPILFGFMTVLFIAIPRIDPLKKNIKKFQSYFDGFIILLYLFFVWIFAQMVLWNFGIEISMMITMPIAMAILMFYIGILLEKAKQNWFIGIRTPWTLSSEKVWDKTHKLGARLFKTLAVIILASLLVPKYSIWIVIMPIIATALWLFIYSYLEFKKEK